MIEIKGVIPTPAELRPAKLASKKARWAAHFMSWIWILGLILVWAVTGWRGDAASAQAGLLALVAAAVIQVVAGRYYTAAIGKASVSGPSPAACDWRIDDAGIHCRMALSNAFYDWRGVSGVSRDGDRFVFSLSPTVNAPLPLRCMTDEQIVALDNLIAEARASGRLGAGVD